MFYVMYGQADELNALVGIPMKQKTQLNLSQIN